MKAERITITRGLPKTGQIISYRAGDDGAYEAGWWVGLLYAENKQRFVSKTISGDDVVIDRATGLMWAADGYGAGCNFYYAKTWSVQLAYANGLTFAGFSDWRMPNIKELGSIVNKSLFNPSIDEPPFMNTGNVDYWSSTTHAATTTNAQKISFAGGFEGSRAKALTARMRAVRGGI